jgi:hypothetical protein
VEEGLGVRSTPRSEAVYDDSRTISGDRGRWRRLAKRYRPEPVIGSTGLVYGTRWIDIFTGEERS